MDTFQPGSPLHLACLLGCVLAAWVVVHRAKRAETPEAKRRIQLFVGIGCLVVWVISAVALIVSEPFDWRSSLPLEFCNLANLIGAIAVLRRIRVFHAILYFWSFALCIWAFLTPVLYHGPAHLIFWIFWIYHLFIILAVIEVLAIQRFRPDWRDFRHAWVATVFYMALLAILARFFGSEYGFVGPSKPESRTLLDALGPYPLRLLWMALIGTVLFALLVLPWRRRS